LSAKQLAAKEALDEAIDDLDPLVRLRCRNPEVREKNGKQILYYPHMDYDERTPPDPITAQAMCTTSGVLCPVAAECEHYARMLKVSTGVWGGRAFVDGQPLGITNNKESKYD